MASIAGADDTLDVDATDVVKIILQWAKESGLDATHAALSAMVSSGDTRIDALVTVAAARRHRRQRRRAREAVRMASKGRCTAASFFRRFVALRRATLVPPPAASRG